MKRILTIILMQLIFGGICYAQTCLPNGITFTTQQEVDDFSSNYPSCTTIEGSVIVGVIGGSNISNLNGLSMLTNIQGSLTCGITSLANFTGLNNLTSIDGNLSISYNSSLTSLVGLESISSVGGNLEIASNSLLANLSGLDNLITVGGNMDVRGCGTIQNLNGLQNLTSINGHLLIESNAVLVSTEGLNNLQTIGGNLRIGSNSNLTSLEGLNNLTSITNGYLYIRDNSNLVTLDALENLTTVEGLIYIAINPSLTSITGIQNINPNLVIASNISNADIEISNNPLLLVCHIQSVCGILDISGRTKDIHDNGSGCNTVAEIENACAALSVNSYSELDHTITLFPNPSESDINIRVSNINFSNNYTITLVNAIGQKISNYSKEVNGDTITINTRTLPSGIYFVTLKFDTKLVSTKFLKK